MPELSPFNAWVARYAAKFGLSKEEAVTLAGWRDDLDAEVEELNQVLKAISRNVADTLGKAECRFNGKMAGHLEAIQAALRRLRSVRYEPAEAKSGDKDWGTCESCQSTGWVQVPHPKAVRDGRWVPTIVGSTADGVYYTFVVTCSCGLGRWVAERREPERKAWSLESYTRFNPGWREQMKKRRMAEMALSDRKTELLPKDEAFNAKLRRILENMFQRANERSNHAPRPF